MKYEMYKDIKEKIDSLYSNNFTHYHTIHHAETIYNMVNVYWKDFQSQFEGFLDIDDIKMELEIAALFHDCIYVPGFNSNEEDSADEADAFLRQIGIDTKIRKKIYELILSTKLNSILDSQEKKFLHDLDWSGFATYEQIIEDEKKVINEFRDAGYLLREVHRGRFEFYKSLEKTVIFQSIFKKYEKIAHRNIERRIIEFNLSI